MSGKLTEEIQQSKPFRLLEEEAVLNVARTADVLGRVLSDFLRIYELSQTQYNVLRILRGSHPEGLACSQISERMITHDPDMTRLLDRLEKRGLVSRLRSTSDRRVVVVSITTGGLKVLKTIDPKISATLTSALSHVSAPRLRQLVELLEELRGGLQ